MFRIVKEAICLRNMSAELKPDLRLEIAHLLLIDVVGYSKLIVNEQIELMHELTQIVRKTECFQAAEKSDKLIRVPTGDGMALVFFHSLEEPVRCALEISKALKDSPRIQLRMGVHSGPINQVRDVNDRVNVAGTGFNVAQRVLDFAMKALPELRLYYIGRSGAVAFQSRYTRAVIDSRSLQSTLQQRTCFSPSISCKQNRRDRYCGFAWRGLSQTLEQF